MLILASESPRRIELLQRLNIPFQSIISGVDENGPRPTTPQEVVRYLAKLKASAVAKTHPDDVIIGSDTIVVINGSILEKAADEMEAIKMLQQLSGHTHEVMTAVHITSPRHSVTWLSVSQVTFYPLSNKDITRYISTDEWKGKAGAYAIQGHGALLIQSIQGDYYTIMGFPIAQVARELEAFAEELNV